LLFEAGLDGLNWNNGITLFLSGAILGLVVAAVGAALEYRLHLSPARPRRNPGPGCLVYTIWGLVLAGIVSVLTSLLLTGGIRVALIIGTGVLAGFYAGFILLLGLWLFFDSRQAS
jgi:hypothetical protein